MPHAWPGGGRQQRFAGSAHEGGSGGGSGGGCYVNRVWKRWEPWRRRSGHGEVGEVGAGGRVSGVFRQALLQGPAREGGREAGGGGGRREGEEGAGVGIGGTG